LFGSARRKDPAACFIRLHIRDSLPRREKGRPETVSLVGTRKGPGLTKPEKDPEEARPVSNPDGLHRRPAGGEDLKDNPKEEEMKKNGLRHAVGVLALLACVACSVITPAHASTEAEKPAAEKPDLTYHEPSSLQLDKPVKEQQSQVDRVFEKVEHWTSVDVGNCRISPTTDPGVKISCTY
jgi:hypothetical protein